MYNNNLLQRRFSEAFKLKILDEFSKGKYSKRDLARLYGIRASTINDWINKYDRKELMNTRIIVQNSDEISKLKLLEKEKNSNVLFLAASISNILCDLMSPKVISE